jgi:hypothetical protein
MPITFNTYHEPFVGSFGYVRRPNRTGRQVLEAIRQLPAAAHVQLGEG